MQHPTQIRAWFNGIVQSSQSQAAEVLADQFQVAADPERAQAQRAYLKSSRKHLGLSVPQERRLVRQWAKAQDITSHGDIWAVAKALWASDIYEHKSAVVELLAFRSTQLVVGDLPAVRSMLANAQTWALVDPMSVDVVGQIIAANPEPLWDSTLDAWSVDDSFWVRRSSMLCQLRLLRSPDYDPTRFFRYADEMMGETEFFIRKAIGWILRDMSKTRPDAVYDWVLPRSAQLSGVSIREAVKYLAPTQQSAIRRARSQPK